MQFDEFYETVGVFGRYQKVKYFLLCFTNMLPPVMVYAWTFIAATPSFRCRTSYDDLFASNITVETLSSYVPTAAQCQANQRGISLKECQRCFQTVNNSDMDGSMAAIVPCRSFLFDRTYYQSTLVEDVRAVSVVYSERDVWRLYRSSFILLVFFFVWSYLVVHGLRSSICENYRSDGLLLRLHGWFATLRHSLGQVR